MCAGKLYFRHLVPTFAMLLIAGTLNCSCLAQEVTVAFLDARSAQPLADKSVDIFFHDSQLKTIARLTIQTPADGMVTLQIPDRAESIDVYLNDQLITCSQGMRALRPFFKAELFHTRTIEVIVSTARE